MLDSLTSTTAGALGLTRATVVEVKGGEVEVAREEGDAPLTCPVLAGVAGRTPLRVGDAVMVLVAGDDAVVLGRIAESPEGAATGPEGAAGTEPPPDELVIEAGSRLTLKVGDGSITIRRDGRILIKGRDLVSHATRTNRIRGGSVAIN